MDESDGDTWTESVWQLSGEHIHITRGARRSRTFRCARMCSDYARRPSIKARRAASGTVTFTFATSTIACASGNQGTTWQEATSVSLSADTTRVRFVLTSGENVYSDMAIDDVQVYSGSYFKV